MKVFNPASLLLLLPLAAVGQQLASPYILAPSDRTLHPVSLYQSIGNVDNAAALGQNTTFTGINSSITVDFGKNIQGTVEFAIDSLNEPNQFLGFTFTESSTYISPYECDSGTDALRDSPLWFSVPSNGSYAAPKIRQRGGFRYMSVWHNSTGSLRLTDLAVNFTAAPDMADLQAYTGYFESSSAKLNRVWYAGAYTNQLCLVDPVYGNALNVPGTDWYYNATISNGSSVLIDGAKRDRLVWPGDIFISGPSIFVSTNDLDGIRNGLDSLMILQNRTDGRLPWAGVPFTDLATGKFQFSFTYHLYTLIDLYDYYLFTGDLDYVRGYWDQYKFGLAWALGTIDASGMANVTSTNDWLRSGMGGHNVEANAILYYTLHTGLELAVAVGDVTVVTNYTQARTSIHSAVNAVLWDTAQGLFFDNDTIQTNASVHPQDGNSWAIISGLVTQDRAISISNGLMARWTPYGSPAPEAGPTISPFASGFEVQAHYLAGFPERSETLMEFMWADFMLDDPRMTNSSLIEGYSTDGSLHYAPYDNDARVSHAHGWATGPTSALTFLGAGIRVLSAAGQTWEMQPRLGNITAVAAGFETPLGSFSANWTVSGQDGALSGTFVTPEGTSGTLVIPNAINGTRVEGPEGRGYPSTVDGGVLSINNLTYTDIRAFAHLRGDERILVMTPDCCESQLPEELWLHIFHLNSDPLHLWTSGRLVSKTWRQWIFTAFADTYVADRKTMCIRFSLDPTPLPNFTRQILRPLMLVMTFHHFDSSDEHRCVFSPDQTFANNLTRDLILNSQNWRFDHWVGSMDQYKGGTSAMNLPPYTIYNVAGSAKDTTLPSLRVDIARREMSFLWPEMLSRFFVDERRKVATNVNDRNRKAMWYGRIYGRNLWWVLKQVALEYSLAFLLAAIRALRYTLWMLDLVRRRARAFLMAVIPLMIRILIAVIRLRTRIFG
ncbi:hypothetical protein LTR49_015068 [Elasticomyces elasticus]|nr:hypothetical protein LTR49_015068 [Elasticomyces elasticus]